MTQKKKVVNLEIHDQFVAVYFGERVLDFFNFQQFRSLVGDNLVWAKAAVYHHDGMYPTGKLIVEQYDIDQATRIYSTIKNFLEA